MRKVLQFCKALERVASLSAVTAVWRHLFGNDWGWAQALLRPTDDLAEAYPRLPDDDGRPFLHSYRVVCHSDEADDYVGVLDDERVELRRADLIIHQLDVRAFCSRLACAMGLDEEFQATGHAPATYRIGSSITNPQISVALCIPSGDESAAIEILRILAQRSEANPIVVVPTKGQRISCGHASSARDVVRVISLEEQLFVEAGGMFAPICIDTPVRRALSPLEKQQEEQPDGCYGARTIVYRGQTHNCDLSTRERAFLDRMLREPELDVNVIMHRSHGIVFRKSYVNEYAPRHLISQFISNLQIKLLGADPPLRVGFRLPRGSDHVVRDDPRDSPAS